MSVRRYAEGTEVSVSSSQAEIGRLVERYGASGFMLGWDGDQAAVAFIHSDRQVRFTLPLSVDAAEIRRNGRGGVRTPLQMENATKAEVRRRWRALALAIKAKLEVVESGIATFEEEFMAHIVLPDGSTVAESVTPAIAQAYQQNGPIRLALPGGES